MSGEGARDVERKTGKVRMGRSKEGKKGAGKDGRESSCG